MVRKQLNPCLAAILGLNAARLIPPCFGIKNPRAAKQMKVLINQEINRNNNKQLN
jgi:hypothetical protein